MWSFPRPANDHTGDLDAGGGRAECGAWLGQRGRSSRLMGMQGLRSQERAHGSAVSHRIPMSRGARTARGAAGALAATLLAAASHGIAGGAITWPAVAVTAILALPLCTALAGRIASLWRLAAAVGIAQFLYHWIFAGIDLVGTARTGPAVSPHAAHLAALQNFAPEVATPASADAAMWLGHAIAAVLTVALLHRGEHAWLALGRLVRRVLPRPRPRLVAVSWRPAIRPLIFRAPLRTRTSAHSAISHRGPPALSFSA